MQKSNYERYANYCQAIETTPLYIEFSFLSLIAACLQRRVWLAGGDWKIFPNLYLIFVGEPATGKTNAARVNFNMLDRLRDDRKELIIKLAPNTVSVEALIRKLSFGVKFFTDEYGKQHPHTSINVISEELANLLKKNDQQLSKFLIQGYDSGDYEKELKGDGKVNAVEFIRNMCINFLAATTPRDMNNFMNLGLLDDGFLGRAIFIWGGKPLEKKLFFIPNPEQIQDLLYVEQYIRCLTTVCGECTLSPEANEFLNNWYLKSDIVLNDDRKLVHYYGRKKINAIKISMCHHFADCYNSRQIGIESVKKALETLARAELDMHKALASAAINPMHTMAELIYNFLQERKLRNPKEESKWIKNEEEFRIIFNAEGNDKVIKGAVEYLLISKKLIARLKNGVLYYEPNEVK